MRLTNWIVPALCATTLLGLVYVRQPRAARTAVQPLARTPQAVANTDATVVSGHSDRVGTRLAVVNWQAGPTPALRRVSGRVTWNDRVEADPTELDGFLRVVWASGRNASLIVTDGQWSLEDGPENELRVLGGTLAGAAVESWPGNVEVRDGCVWYLSRCRSRLIHVLDGEGAPLSEVTVLRSEAERVAHAHPGEPDTREVVFRAQPSPLRIDGGVSGNGSLWVTAPGFAWRALDLNEATPEEVTLHLEQEARLSVSFLGPRPSGNFLVSARVLETRAPIFERAQADSTSFECSGLAPKRMEIALLRGGVGWDRPISTRVVELKAGQRAEAVLEWPTPVDRSQTAQVIATVEFVEDDLPQELLADLRASFYLLDERGALFPRASRTIPFERWKRVHPRRPIWELQSSTLLPGSYALMLEAVGFQCEVSVYTGLQHLDVVVGPLARTLLEPVDSSGAVVDLPDLRAMRIDPSPGAPPPLQLAVTRAEDGVGYVLHCPPGQLQVSSGKRELQPMVRSYEVDAGWNHVVVEFAAAHRLSLRVVCSGESQSRPTHWWRELVVSTPSPRARVLGCRFSDLSEEGAARFDLLISEPGVWGLEFPAADGSMRRQKALVDATGHNELTLDLTPIDT